MSTTHRQLFIAIIKIMKFKVSQLNNRDRVIYSAIIIALIFLALWFFFGRQTVESYEFVGQIKKIEGDSLYLHGLYKGLDGEYLEDQPSGGQDVKVLIVSETTFIKVKMFLPSIKDLGPDRKYNPADLKKEEVDGSRDDLQNVNGIFVKSDNNIFGKSKFKASDIRYIFSVNPS